MSKRKIKETPITDESSKKSKFEPQSGKRLTKKNLLTSQEQNSYDEFFNNLNKLLEKNELNLNEIVTTLTNQKGFTSKHEKEIIKSFSKLIHKKDFDDTTFINMLELIDDDYLKKNKSLCEFLLTNLYSIKIENKPGTSKEKKSEAVYMPQKIFQFKSHNLHKLVKESFRLISICSYARCDLIYENIINLFIKLDFNSEKYLKEKNNFIKAEKLVIDKFHDLLTSNTSLVNKNEINNDILKAFKSIINTHSVYSIMNNFLFVLYLSLLNDLNERTKDQLTQHYFKLLEKYIEITILTNKTEWMKQSLKKRFDLNKFLNIINYTDLILYINKTKLVDNLVEFCLTILDTYGCEINEFLVQPRNINEYFSYLVVKIAEQLVKKSKEGRYKILNEFLHRALHSDKKIVYISILDIICNNETTLKALYFHNAQEERETLNRLVINKLTSNVIGKKNKIISSSKFALFDFEKPEHAIRLLKVFRVFYYTSNKTHKDCFENLYNLLKNNVSNSSLNVRKISLFGLMTILIEMNYDHLLHTHIYFRSEFKIDRDVCLNGNLKFSNDIIELIRFVLVSQEQDSSIKSKLYQMLYSIAKCAYDEKKKSLNTLNSYLLKPIALIFKQQLDKYVIRANDSDFLYFNLDKCISSENFKLIEPIDILIHCADLFTSNFNKHITQTHPAYLTTNSIQLIISQLKRAYLDKDSKYLFDIYKQQLQDKVNKQESPAMCMKIIHQIELGFIDVLLEHTINNEYYNDITKILEKYETTSNLISIEIENLMSSITTRKLNESVESEDLNKKRKLEGSVTQVKTKTTSSKKLKKSNDSDKENQPKSISVSKQSDSKTTRRETLADISNRKVISSSHSQKSPTSLSILKNLSFANIQFEHEHRISFKCCLKMIKLYLGSYDKDMFQTNQIKSNQSFLNCIVSLILNERFVEFLIKVVEKKLKSLTNDYENIYDPQSKNPHQIFEFLSGLWLSFCQRLNGTIGEDKSVYKPDLAQRFGPSFLNKSYRFIQSCQMIWNIINNKYQVLRQKLVRNEKQYYSFSDYNYMSLDEKKCTPVYWTFLKNCARTLKNHLNPSPLNSIIANKCVAALLSLMNDITQVISLTEENYESFSNFLFELADHKVAEDQEVGKILINLLCFIANKQYTSAIIIKYFTLEYSNQVYFMQEDCQEEIRDTIDETTSQFTLFTKDSNMVEYQEIINSQLNDLFEKFKWSLENKNLFSQTHILISLVKQLDTIVLALHYNLNSVSKFDSAELCLKLLSNFYQFLELFFQSGLIKRLNEDGFYMIYDLTARINDKLQSSLSTELNRINDLIVCDEQQKDDKTNSKQIFNIIRYKECIGSLITSIDHFEQQLINLNNNFGARMNVNLLNVYNKFISSLELNFNSRIIRTVSEIEINTILNMKN